MSKLWIFGDSYSIPLNYVDAPESVAANIDKTVYTTNWITEVEKKLPINEVKIFSQFGVANEWIFQQVMEQSNSCSP